MQPADSTPVPEPKLTDGLVLAELLRVNIDYAILERSIVRALGLSEADLRDWESKVESVLLSGDDDDFEVMPPRGGETEFILDDPDEDDEDDEDAESEDKDEADDESEDDDELEDDEDDDDDDGERDDDDEEDDDDIDPSDIDPDDFETADDVRVEEDDGES